MRPCYPPTFEDIFETDHYSEDNGSMFKDTKKYSSKPDLQFGKESNKQQKVLILSKKLIIEMDRNSNSVKSSNKASDSLDKVEENQQQMLSYVFRCTSADL